MRGLLTDGKGGSGVKWDKDEGYTERMKGEEKRSGQGSGVRGKSRR